MEPQITQISQILVTRSQRPESRKHHFLQQKARKTQTIYETTDSTDLHRFFNEVLLEHEGALAGVVPLNLK
jgi:hypothetical protein